MFKNPLKAIIGKGKAGHLAGEKPLDDFEKEVLQDLEDLLADCKRNLPAFNEQLIIKAFNRCVITHRDKVRKSGEPYYKHLVNVARIVVNEIPLDDISVACALLHETLDESDPDNYNIKDLRSEFGSTIAEIIDGVTKIEHIESQGIGRMKQFENYQKLILSLFKDVRIILIKLADRLHNMRTLEYITPDKQLEYATETLEIYSPFANRFGLGNLKWELEDLSFKYLHRKEYDEMKDYFQEKREDREDYIKQFVKPISERLQKDELIKKHDIKFEISGRPKHFYSTYYKMKNRGLPIEELNDLFAIRIILDTDDKNLCFYVYGIVCEIYQPVPGTFKNYIHIPKKNGYQSIHTAVAGMDNKHVEVQIRTRAMHTVAERGVAAHFKYKQDLLPAQSIFEDRNLQEWMDKVRRIFENAGDETPEQMLESVRQNLFQEEIYVFTPTDELRTLPKGATPLDFAFDIHSEIGSHCIGAKVNGRIVPLDYKIRNGDQVEILISEKQNPTVEWLNFVVSSKARTAIQKYLAAERKNIVSYGKSIWEDNKNELGFSISRDELDGLLAGSKFGGEDEFFYLIGSGKLSVSSAIHFIGLNYKISNNYKTAGSGNGNGKPNSSKAVLNDNQDTQKNSVPGSGRNLTSLPVNYAKCCNPIPGDRIMGAISFENELIIHRRECAAIEELFNEKSTRLVELDWSILKTKDFSTDILISGQDRPGLLNEVTSAIIACDNANIRGITLNTFEDKFRTIISISIKDTGHFNKLSDTLLAVPGVSSVERTMKS